MNGLLWKSSGSWQGAAESAQTRHSLQQCHVWVKASELPPRKRQITLRLDADVIDFFQHTGKRYQTRINAVLRTYVEARKKAQRG